MMLTRTRPSRWLSLLIVTMFADPAQAVTRSYEALVTFSAGPHSHLFPRGVRLRVSYTLSPLAKDFNSSPLHGRYPEAVRTLSVTFPDLGVFAVAGPAGDVLTFNDVQQAGLKSDQVFFFGGPIVDNSLIEGEPIHFLEVDFLSDFITPPDLPTMLTSDAIPLTNLPTTNAFLFLGSPSGFTSVHFMTDSPPPGCKRGDPGLCFGKGRFKVELAWQAGGSPPGFGEAVQLTEDSGYFWFFDSQNVEVVVKVLDACLLGSYWVFAAGLTNVETALSVLDIEADKVNIYINPDAHPFQPIQDTAAFATCP